MKLADSVLHKPVFLLLLTLCFSVLLSSSAARIDMLPLSNGNTCFYTQNDRSENTVVHLFFSGGLYYEPRHLPGLSRLSVGMFLYPKDPEKMNRMVINSSRYYIRILENAVVISIEMLSDHVESDLPTIIENLKKKRVDRRILRSLKKLMDASRKREAGNPDLLRDSVIRSVLLFKGADRRSVYGTEKSIKAIRKRDVSDFYDRHINSANLIISISTNLKKAKISEILDKSLSGFPEGKVQAVPDISLNKDTVHRSEAVKTSMGLYALCFAEEIEEEETPERLYVMGRLLETLMGRGIGSKLWVLRDKHRLAYTIRSYFEFYRSHFRFIFDLKTDPSDISESAGLLKKLLEKIHREGISKPAFNREKRYCLASFNREQEQKRVESYSAGYYQFVGLGANLSTRFEALLDGIEYNDFVQFVKRILAPKNRRSIFLGDPSLKVRNDSGS